MQKFILFIFILFTLCACYDKPNIKNPVEKKRNNTAVKDSIMDSPQANLKNFETDKIKDALKLDNGLVIKWITKGSGNTLLNGEVVLIEYRLSLPDGKIVDGNEHAKLPFIPFIVGFNMQTLGWDIALTKLRVGDFVKVEMPKQLAHGEKGIPGVIPPNSANWLYLKIKARVTPEYNLNGIKTWTFAEGKESESFSGRLNEIVYNVIASTASNPEVMNTYRAKFPLKYISGQKNIVPGLEKVLSKAKKGQKIYVLLEPNQAYGDKGYVNIVKPNEAVFYNISIKDIRPI